MPLQKTHEILPSVTITNPLQTLTFLKTPFPVVAVCLDLCMLRNVRVNDFEYAEEEMNGFDLSLSSGNSFTVRNRPDELGGYIDPYAHISV